MRTVFLFTLLLVSVATAPAARQTYTLTEGWHFIRQDAGPAATPGEGWTTVSVPHTWNAFDGQNGKAADPGLPDGYYRGPGWYYLPLNVPADLGDRRVILRCEAVSEVADVYLNEAHVGQHRGAFTAFAFDLTPYLRQAGPNVLRIRADNGRFLDVAPITGDFTVCGGIYRPVQLLIVDPVHLSLADHGTRGVYVTTRQLAADRAEVEVRALATNDRDASALITLETSITDAAGQLVARQQRTLDLSSGKTQPAQVVLSIAQPHRWQGRRDPYLYHVAVRLLQGGRELDSVTEAFGLRTVAIDEARGFLLNGEPYPVRGVGRHQDRLDQGWAVSAAEEEEDLRLICAMGATAVRLAHYPQSENIHALADRMGLLLWEEIPNIERVPSLPEFAVNLRQQCTEMILQGYNHPSLAFWGLFNEAKAVWLPPFGAPPEPLLNELHTLTTRLDSSRLVVGASWLRDHDPLHDTVSYPAFNQYPGWKYDTPEDMGPIVDLISRNHGGRRIALAEYGAAASVHQHQESGLARPASTETTFHPEEWQAIVHEVNWRQLKDNPHIWGSFAWVMFDFAADNRHEGDTPGRNDKGLVTADRKTRKDAYFFYQANWTAEPMVHLAARRLDRRRLNPVPEIKVYSNCPEVELLVNGASLGRRQPDGVAICRWPDVNLQPGTNRIEVIAHAADGREVRDSCTWMLASIAGDAVHAAALPAAPGGIIFTGSSSIRLWATLAADFPGLPVVNRGFGGSWLDDCVSYEKSLVLDAQPRLVVLYAGDNDLAAGHTPEQVLHSFQAFRANLHAALPHTRLLFLAIKESPSRARYRDAMRQANALVAAACAADPLCQFVDTATPLLDAAGRTRPELFLPDRLHLSPDAYAIWAALLRPLIAP